MNLNTLNVLIVDDEPELREFLVEILSELSISLFEAADGVEALEVLGRESIDLILTDINMPKMGGFELLENVSSKYPDILTIVITTLGDKDTVLKALKLHAYDFFEKPLKNDIVISKVEHVLEVCYNRKLLNLALKEWMMSRFSNLQLSKFEEKSIQEQNQLLEAALKIFKLKSLSS